ncbi:MAG: DUF6057 family protein, partial [Armatimonadota bacterium]|nr:DUF6057 family protein [Armatimonadota bacterium]
CALAHQFRMGHPELMRKCACIQNAHMDPIWSLQSEVMKILASPRRLEILHLLAEEPKEVGRLAEEMFTRPRVTPKMILALQEPPLFGYLWRQVDLLTRLGRINDAQHFASEALGMLGPNPHILQQLATIHLVKGEMEAARLYLNALLGDLWHAAWARAYLRAMEGDPSLAGVPEIQHLREVALQRDDVAEVTQYLEDSPEEAILFKDLMLEHLLDQNPKNRMAAEYLMGHFLLTRRLDLFVAALPRLDPFHMQPLPRAYQEALALYLELPGQHAELGRYAPGPDAIERCRRFRRMVEECGENRQQARDKAAEYFADTYFFYYFYGPGAGL